MTKLRKIVLLSTMVLTIGAASVTSFAATAPVTGTNGIDPDKLEQWQAERLELRKEILQDRVDAGLITQEQADAVIEQMIERQAVCDGTGAYGLGRMGNGNGLGRGYGQGLGQGYGPGYGMGGCLYYQNQ